MARSHRIYTVLDGDRLVAAFTVKHELERWLGKNVDNDDADRWKVYSCRDGMRQRPYNTMVVET